jgi:hypothetical protein
MIWKAPSPDIDPTTSTGTSGSSDHRLSVQYLPDSGRELGLADRLLDQVDAIVKPAVVDYGVARVAGHVQHRQAGP